MHLLIRNCVFFHLFCVYFSFGFRSRVFEEQFFLVEKSTIPLKNGLFSSKKKSLLFLKKFVLFRNCMFKKSVRCLEWAVWMIYTLHVGWIDVEVRCASVQCYPKILFVFFSLSSNIQRFIFNKGQKQATIYIFNSNYWFLEAHDQSKPQKTSKKSTMIYI